ncbi:large neutral amino acids transporter small subunit 4-like [Lingula anatina]|uniref:Large neutral amino acids transporter small subunit 4-like n=1 Tax=Lingula anatina TaxID=7574 RepID=A0A1S3JH70_LINAN|nr:large neutral amino acids transporter small subunit 4-like [Lingula anatina]|eukprot:XP_013409244.1 large neutral amino acids transporter small subunit 4-like [Lingula anatina]
MADTMCWKVFRVFFGILEAAVYSATITGWPAFMYIFIEEGFYYSRCDFDIVANASYNMTSSGCTGLGNCTQDTTGEDLVLKCTEQEEMLNLVYTVSLIGLGALFILGYVYDHCGSVCLRIISIHSVELINSRFTETEWLLFPGAIFNLMGGLQLALTDVQVAVLFPKLKATLICLVSGATDVSGFVPILLKMAYQAGVSYKMCMFTFAGIILLMSSVNTITLPPRQDEDGNNIDIACCFKIRKRNRFTKGVSKHDKEGCFTVIDKVNKNDVDESAVNEQLVKANEEASVEPDDINCHNALNMNTTYQHYINANRKETCFDGSAPMIHGVGNPDSKKDDESTNIGVLHGTLLILKSTTFWVLMLWLICQDTVIITYDGCFYAIISYYGNNVKNTVSTYTDVYSWFQVSSLFWALLTGLMLDKLVAKTTKDDKTHCFVVPFFLTVAAGIVVSIACVIPIIEMQFVAILFQCIFKSGTFAVHLAFLEAAFPKEHFGKALGIQVTVSSLLTFIELPIFSWYNWEYYFWEYAARPAVCQYTYFGFDFAPRGLTALRFRISALKNSCQNGGVEHVVALGWTNDPEPQ